MESPEKVGPVLSDTPLVWTIGHSSRPAEVFLELLKAESIEQVADVRRYPGSRAHPHFNADRLAAFLGGHGIRYCPFPELGGRRSARKASANTVWKNAAFRAYADYMETAEFRAGLDRFVRAAAEQRTAIMCSEAVWWRCHRSLIADALKAAGMQVLHIMGTAKPTVHPYTSPARVVDGRLQYGSGPD